MNISIIGFGNMAKALVKNLQNNPDLCISVASPSLPVGVNQHGIQTHSNNRAIIATADVLILAVKPAQVKLVLDEIEPELPTHCLIISVASGLYLDWFNLNRPIIRAMPNIAAAVGQSATPLIANQFATDLQKNIAEQLFSSMGLTTWITEESQMDALTALSGSGPAYVFLFMDAMISAAIELGVPKDIASTFTFQTVQGALSLATSSNRSLTELRSAVTSPGGTTAAAINVFMNHGFNDMIHHAMQAAVERSIALGSAHKTTIKSTE